jgi:hypothetical protein
LHSHPSTRSSVARKPRRSDSESSVNRSLASWRRLGEPPRSSPALRSRSLAVRALLRPPVAPSAPPLEVPGFGAVLLIARSACVTDRGAGRTSGSPLGVRAGGRWRDSRRPPEPASRPSGGSPSRLRVCSIVKGPSPHSVPIRLDPEGSRFLLSPHLVPLEFLPVPGESGSAPRDLDSCRGHVRGGRNSMGTRREPSGICVAVADHEAAGQAVPSFDRYGVRLWQSGYESRPSPIQRRATAPKRDALRGENPGSFGGVQVRRLCATSPRRGNRSVPRPGPRVNVRGRSSL